MTLGQTRVSRPERAFGFLCEVPEDSQPSRNLPRRLLNFHQDTCQLKITTHLEDDGKCQCLALLQQTMQDVCHVSVGDKTLG